MKILVLTNLYPPHYIGGYELICQTVVEELRQRGHDVRILTSNHVLESAPQQVRETAVERSLEINGFYGHPWRGGWSLYRLEKHNNETLRAALGREGPDLVYVWNMGGLSKSLLLTLQGSGVPTVCYVSDHWIARGISSDAWMRWWNGPDASWLNWAVRGLSGPTGLRRRWDACAPTGPISRFRFRGIYFCSRALRDLTAAAGFDVAHGSIIYCPVHPRFFQGEPAPPREKVEKLLYVGRLAEDKGVMTALQALALLRGKFEGGLTICGRGEADYVSRLKAFAEQSDLKVTFSSVNQEEMPRLYRSHDLLLFTSEWAEPFALTPIEAMASGLPVIGTMTGGSAELFRDAENALVYTAGQASELADRIAEFTSDYALRSRCAAQGYREAEQGYAAPVVVDQIEAFLEMTARTWGHSEALSPVE